MKELTDEFRDNKVEIVAEKEQRKEIKLIGNQRKIRGLTLWEYNEKTNELKPATFKKEDVVLISLAKTPEALQKRSNVIVKEGCIYFQALNKNNARKKLGFHN